MNKNTTPVGSFSPCCTVLLLIFTCCGSIWATSGDKCWTNQPFNHGTGPKERTRNWKSWDFMRDFGEVFFSAIPWGFFVPFKGWFLLLEKFVWDEYLWVMLLFYFVGINQCRSYRKKSQEIHDCCFDYGKDVKVPYCSILPNVSVGRTYRRWTSLRLNLEYHIAIIPGTLPETDIACEIDGFQTIFVLGCHFSGPLLDSGEGQLCRLPLRNGLTKLSLGLRNDIGAVGIEAICAAVQRGMLVRCMPWFIIARGWTPVQYMCSLGTFPKHCNSV